MLQIRQFPTQQLQALDSDTAVSDSIRAMRAACRKFLDAVGPTGYRSDPIGYGYDSWVFTSARGELRGSFGIHLATFATSYGLDMEDDLASILPTAADDETPHD